MPRPKPPIREYDFGSLHIHAKTAEELERRILAYDKKERPRWINRQLLEYFEMVRRNRPALELDQWMALHQWADEAGLLDWHPVNLTKLRADIHIRWLRRPSDEVVLVHGILERGGDAALLAILDTVRWLEHGDGTYEGKLELLLGEEA